MKWLCNLNSSFLANEGSNKFNAFIIIAHSCQTDVKNQLKKIRNGSIRHFLKSEIKTGDGFEKGKNIYLHLKVNLSAAFSNFYSNSTLLNFPRFLIKFTRIVSKNKGRFRGCQLIYRCS